MCSSDLGIERVEKFGPYMMGGEAEVLNQLERLLESFIEQRRMKIDLDGYEPCWCMQRVGAAN